MEQTAKPNAEVARLLVDNHRKFREFVYRRVGNVADADEILQAAFVKSIEKAEAIRDEESAVAWFYRVLRNAVADHYRHVGAEGRALERNAHLSFDDPEPAPDLEQAICECVADVLPTLNDEYADILRRVDLEEVSIAEFSSRAQITPNNARVKLHRARAALRKQLEVTCGTCTEHGCLDCSCKKKLGAS